jgi:hypothetical protein
MVKKSNGVQDPERLPSVSTKRTELEDKRLIQDPLRTKTPPATTEEKIQRIVGTPSSAERPTRRIRVPLLLILLDKAGSIRTRKDISEWANRRCYKRTRATY